MDLILQIQVHIREILFFMRINVCLAKMIRRLKFVRATDVLWYHPRSCKFLKTNLNLHHGLCYCGCTTNNHVAITKVVSSAPVLSMNITRSRDGSVPVIYTKVVTMLPLPQG